MMNNSSSVRPKPWSFYAVAANPSPSQTGGADNEVPWMNFGTSLNAISFGFVATAILISMFLIMAIFEHLLRPRPSFSQDANEGSLELGTMQDQLHILEKLENSQSVSTSDFSGLSVLMPGQHYPTFIAQPAPLPCTREGLYYWHSNNLGFVYP